MDSFVNWQAIAAVATFCAVLVALCPILQGEIRRRAQARNLRFRILTHLTQLRPMVARRFQDTPLGLHTTSGLTGEEAETVIVLESLLAQAHILDAKEHDLVATAVTNLVLSKSVQKLGPDTARNILDLIDQARDELDKGKFLRGKFPNLPWYVLSGDVAKDREEYSVKSSKERFMNQKPFSLISGVIFLLIAILHVLRIIFAWDAVIGGWEVPKWISWAAIVGGVYLAYEGFRLSRKSP